MGPLLSWFPAKMAGEGGILILISADQNMWGTDKTSQMMTPSLFVVWLPHCESDMAPENPLALMWPVLILLVTWHYHAVLVVVVVHVGRQKRVGAIDDGSNEMRVVVVNKGSSEGGCCGWWQDGGGGKTLLWFVDGAKSSICVC